MGQKVTPRGMARAVMAALRHKAPAFLPVKLEWRKTIDKDDLGEADLKMRPRPHFVIRLSEKEVDTPHLAWHTVVHEYGHVLGWTKAHRNLKDHGPLFGAGYSIAYTAAETMLG